MVVGRVNNKKRKGGPSSKGKGKGKQSQGKPPAKKKQKGKKGNEKQEKCFRCGQKGHWKRNCKAILLEGIFVIDLHMSSLRSTYWVLNTRCTSHICNSLKVLTNKTRIDK